MAGRWRDPDRSDSGVTYVKAGRRRGPLPADFYAPEGHGIAIGGQDIRVEFVTRLYLFWGHIVQKCKYQYEIRKSFYFIKYLYILIKIHF
jgi:hypothetical protein